MASRTVSDHCAPANPMTSPEASRSPTKDSKTSKVKILEDPSHKNQDSLRSLAKQPTGSTGPGPFQPKTCYCLNLCLLPPAQPTPVHSPIPDATSVFLPGDGLTELQLMDQICASKKSLSLVMAPPVKLPHEVARRPKSRTQPWSQKSRDKEVLGFSINLVLSSPDLSASDIPEHLTIPEAREVTIPVNPC